MNFVAWVVGHWGTAAAVCGAFAALVAACAKALTWAFARWRDYQAEQRLAHDHQASSLWGALKAQDAHLDQEQKRFEQLRTTLHELESQYTLKSQENAKLQALAEAQSENRYQLAEKLALLGSACGETLSSSLKIRENYIRERNATVSDVRTTVLGRLAVNPEKLAEYEERGAGPENYQHAALLLAMFRTLEMQAETYVTLLTANASMAIKIATFLRDNHNLAGEALRTVVAELQSEHAADVAAVMSGRLESISPKPRAIGATPNLSASASDGRMPSKRDVHRALKQTAGKNDRGSGEGNS
jgi:DNA repair exonuclease SbcCD ATPase subunit